MRKKMNWPGANAAVALTVYGVYAALIVPVAGGSLRYLLPSLLLPAALLLLWLAFVQPGRIRPVLLALSGLAALCFVGTAAMLAFPGGAVVSLGTATLNENAWPDVRLAIAAVYMICVTVLLFAIAVMGKKREAGR